MTLSESVRTCFRKYATFQGRASRPEYWYFVLFGLLCSLAIGLAGALCLVLGDLSPSLSFLGLLLPLLGALSSLVQAALFLPGLAVACRRLHDRNMSGWWMLAPGLLMLVGAIVCVSGASTGQGVNVATFLAGVVLLLAAPVWGVVMFARKGTDGPNRFGAPACADAFQGPEATQASRAGGVLSWDRMRSEANPSRTAAEECAAPSLCPGCGSPMPAQGRFCTECGRPRGEGRG